VGSKPPHYYKRSPEFNDVIKEKLTFGRPTLNPTD
jgi:hypothetical protein